MARQCNEQRWLWWGMAAMATPLLAGAWAPLGAAILGCAVTRLWALTDAGHTGAHPDARLGPAVVPAPHFPPGQPAPPQPIAVAPSPEQTTLCRAALVAADVAPWSWSPGEGLQVLGCTQSVFGVSQPATDQAGAATSTANPTEAALRERVHPEDVGKLHQYLQGMVGQPDRGARQIELRFTDDRGATRWACARFQVECGDNGEVLRALGVAHDVTRRKRVEQELLDAWDASEGAARAAQRRAEELRREKARVGGIFEAVKDGILTADSAGTITAVNPAAEQLFGYPPGGMVGMALGEAIPTLAGTVDPDLKPLLPRGETLDRGAIREVLALRSDGSSFAAELSVNRGQLRSQHMWVGVVRDITERVEYEAELRRARRQAEEATAAKSAFLANLSHEIRTPLTAVIGFADVLNETRLDREQTDAVARVLRSGQHLRQLIDDILDLSKIEAGQMTVEHIPCDLRQLIEDVVHLLDGPVRAKGLAFDTVVSPGVPQWVATDPTRLRQVALNLLGNAIKFTDRGRIRLEVEWRNGTLAVEVEDSGLGMNEAQAGELFEPFRQADISTSRCYGGTGLGLSITRRLCQLMGGNCSIVHTAPGRGTRFHFEVRAEQVSAPVATAASGHQQDASRFSGRVLLAEDSGDNQVLIRRILEKAGAQVAVVAHGGEAVDAVLTTDTPYDVILMDMQMPVMDGYAATAALRAMGYTGTIVALTANAMDGDRERCIETGCDSYIPKPINGADLLAALGRLVRPLGRSPATERHG